MFYYLEKNELIDLNKMTISDIKNFFEKKCPVLFNN